MFNVPKLTILAREAIKELQAVGIQATPEEVLLFNKLGELSLSPDDFQLLTFCYQSYGNLKVYPLTLGAKLWLQRFAEEHPFDETSQTYAILYAMSNSRNPEALEALDFSSKKEVQGILRSFASFVSKIFSGKKEVQSVLRSFAGKINLTEEEIQRLLAKTTTENVEGKKSISPEGMQVEEDLSMIPAIALLMNTYGKDTQYWLWQETEDTCTKMIQEALKLNSEGKYKGDDKSLLAFAEIKKNVARIKRERMVAVQISETKDKVI